MTAKELSSSLGAEILAGEGEKEIKSGFCCDLLSVVMGASQPGMAWVTVQAHMNVIAVAALGDMACVILTGDAPMNPECVEKAREEGVCVMRSSLSSYAVCARMAALRIQ